MFGSLFGAAAPSGDDEGGGHGAAGGVAGLDLHHGANLAELEDEGLQARMEAARQALASFTLRCADLPPADALAGREAEMQRELSALNVRLTGLHRGLQVATDAVAAAAGHAAELAEGRVPRGFPAPTPAAPGAAGALLARRLADAQAELDALAGEAGAVAVLATRTRRACEGAVGGLRARGAAAEAELGRLAAGR